jgi:hypothetical protein
MRNLEKTRVLIAATPESVSLFFDPLSEQVEVVFSSSLEDAMSRQYDQIDVIVCSITFDESRMFDFLRYAKLNSHARVIPFICVNVTDKLLSSTFEQSIQIACMALGAAGFVDLNRWKNQHGATEACRMFQQLIQRLGNK